MLSRINVINIIIDHIKTFKSDSTKGGFCYIEFMFFYIALPIIILVMMLCNNISLPNDFANRLIQIYAILAGFLINALIILTDKRNYYDDSQRFAKRLNLLEETFSNTAFGLLICILLVILISIYSLIENSLLKVIIYSLSIIFIHTILMVIKRLAKVFSD